MTSARVRTASLLAALAVGTAACDGPVMLAEDWNDSALAVTVTADDRLLLVGVDIDSERTTEIADLSALLDDWTPFASEVQAFAPGRPLLLAVPADGSAQRVVAVDPGSDATVAAELDEAVFPLSGDGWASAVVADGATIGSVRYGPWFDDLSATADIGFVPVGATVDHRDGTVVYAGTTVDLELRVAWLDPASGLVRAQALAEGELAAGVAVRDGVVAITVNREHADGTEAEAPRALRVRIIDGDDHHAIDVPLNPVLVSFVDDGRIAVEGLGDDGRRRVVVAEVASGEIVADVPLPTPDRVVGLRLAEGRLIVVQPAAVTVVSPASGTVDATIPLPGLTSTTLLP